VRSHRDHGYCIHLCCQRPEIARVAGKDADLASTLTTLGGYQALIAWLLEIAALELAASTSRGHPNRCRPMPATTGRPFL
jgi:hypothetical protein